MLEKIKDWFYDTSDLLAAIVIIIAAVFIIWGRIESIMSFPDSYDAQAALKSDSEAVIHINEPSDSNDSDNADSGSDISSADSAASNGNQEQNQPDSIPPSEEENKAGAADTPPAAAASVKITIPSGAAGEKIAQILKDNGLVSDTSVFLTALKNSGKESKLRSGTYNIPSGSTPDQIILILTQN